MAHFLVTQLRFARSEFVRGLEGISAEDAVKRLMPMNCISWMIGHLADQEQRYWVLHAQGHLVVAGLNERVGNGQPASTPPLDEMWSVWKAITAAADEYLDTLTSEILANTHQLRDSKPMDDNLGTLLLRNIYHYWVHTGEVSAIRQMLNHPQRPEFVGDMSAVNYQ